MSWLGWLFVIGGVVAVLVLCDLLFCKGQYCRLRMVRVFISTAASVAALTGCSPLPGPSFDPLYLGRGTQPTTAAAQTAASAGTETSRPESKPVGTSVWVGRYQDNRGAGEVTFTFLRGQSTVSGTWKLRTGGGGPLTGVVQAGGRRIELRMESIAPECPAMFEGSAEISESALIGTYHGKDCEGPVADGRLELHPSQR